MNQHAKYRGSVARSGRPTWAAGILASVLLVSGAALPPGHAWAEPSPAPEAVEPRQTIHVETLRGQGPPDVPAWVPLGKVSEADADAFTEELSERAASPDPAVDLDPNAEFGDFSAVQLQDAVDLAAHTGTPVKDMLIELSGSSDFGVLAADWERQYPDGFVEWGIDESRASGPSVYLVWNGALPVDVAREAKKSNTDLISVWRSNFSRQEADEAALKVHELLARKHDLATLTSYVETREATIVVTAPPSQKFGDVSDYAQAESSRLGYRASLTEDDEIAIELHDDAARGGAEIRGCTSAFTLRRSSGATAVGTAGHCATHNRNGTYRNHPVDGSEGYTLRNPTSYYFNGYDLGFYPTGPLSPLQTFYSDFNSKRYVEDTTAAGTDSWVWIYGHTTRERQPAQVDVFSRNCTVDGVTVTGVTSTASSNLQGGDSGGPAYNGAGAAGVYYGTCAGDAFTRVGLYPVAGPWSVWER